MNELVCTGRRLRSGEEVVVVVVIARGGWAADEPVDDLVLRVGGRGARRQRRRRRRRLRLRPLQSLGAHLALLQSMLEALHRSSQRHGH